MQPHYLQEEDARGGCGCVCFLTSSESCRQIEGGTSHPQLTVGKFFKASCPSPPRHSLRQLRIFPLAFPSSVCSHPCYHPQSPEISPSVRIPAPAALVSMGYLQLPSWLHKSSSLEAAEGFLDLPRYLTKSPVLRACFADSEIHSVRT